MRPCSNNHRSRGRIATDDTNSSYDIFSIKWQFLEGVVVAEVDTRNDQGHDQDYDRDQSLNNIGLIGLGAIDTAVARCFIDKGYSVHAWNRSSKKVEDILNDRVNVNTDTDGNDSLTFHSTPQGVFDASKI